MSAKRCLGIRCSNNSYAFAIVSGTRAVPHLEQQKMVQFPKNYNRPNSLRWFLQEIEDLLKAETLTMIAMKDTEPAARTGAEIFIQRVENEAIVLLVAAQHNLADAVHQKVNATIAKDLLNIGKAKLLKTDLDTRHFPGFAEYDEKIADAIRVAWSCL